MNNIDDIIIQIALDIENIMKIIKKFLWKEVQNIYKN